MIAQAEELLTWAEVFWSAGIAILLLTLAWATIRAAWLAIWNRFKK